MQKHARQARAPQAPTSGSPAPPHLRSVYLAQKALPARRQLLGPSPARTAPTARLAQDLPRNAARARTVPRLPESPASARLPSTSPNVQLTSTHTARMAPTALKVPALRRLAQQDTSERARGRTWTTSRAAPAATQASLQWRVRTLARPAQRATCASARQPPPQEEGGASNERGSSAPPAPSTRARATGAHADSTALLGPRLSAPARREPISQLQASLRWPPASLAQLVRSAVTSARQLAGPAKAPQMQSLALRAASASASTGSTCARSARASAFRATCLRTAPLQTRTRRWTARKGCTPAATRVRSSTQTASAECRQTAVSSVVGPRGPSSQASACAAARAASQPEKFATVPAVRACPSLPLPLSVTLRSRTW